MRRSRTGFIDGWLLLGTLALLAAGCGQKEVVKYGAVLPLTGEYGIYGQPIRKGIEVALEQIKAERGAPAMELTVLDSEGDPERARDQLTELYDSGVLAVIGGVTTPEAEAMVPVADQRDRVLLSPSASSPSLTGISRNFYRVFPSDFREGTKIAQHAAQELNLETVVILAAESPFAKGIYEIFQNEFERHGGKVLDLVVYPPNTADFAGLVGRVMTLEPDGVYIADYGEPTAKMLKALRDAGYKGTLLTTSAFAAPEALAAAGRAAEGVLVPQPDYNPDDLEPEDAVAIRFVEAYRQKYGETPGLYAAHGYDAMLVLEAARQKGGSPTDLWRSMRAIRALPGVTGALQFDEKGDVQKFPRVYFIKDGKLIDHKEYIDDLKRQLREEQERIRRELEELRRRSGGS